MHHFQQVVLSEVLSASTVLTLDRICGLDLGFDLGIFSPWHWPGTLQLIGKWWQDGGAVLS